jgi:hypothetical protein
VAVVKNLPLQWRNSNTAITSTAPHSQGELNLFHVDDKGEEEEGEGEILDEDAPCWPKLYMTGIVPEAKLADRNNNIDKNLFPREEV